MAVMPRSPRLVRWWIAVAYVSAAAVIASPFIDYRHLATMSYDGDVDLVRWTLAWDSHALLNWLPLFQANVFYPATNALQYNEHLVGLALFYLPVFAISRNPVLAYNVV